MASYLSVSHKKNECADLKASKSNSILTHIQKIGFGVGLSFQTYVSFQQELTKSLRRLRQKPHAFARDGYITVDRLYLQGFDLMNVFAIRKLRKSVRLRPQPSWHESSILTARVAYKPYSEIKIPAKKMLCISFLVHLFVFVFPFFVVIVFQNFFLITNLFID